jgi:hypothetical protein
MTVTHLESLMLLWAANNNNANISVQKRKRFCRYMFMCDLICIFLAFVTHFLTNYHSEMVDTRGGVYRSL